jgi:hypothetical protein
MMGKGHRSARWTASLVAAVLLVVGAGLSAQPTGDESTVATVEARFWGFSSNPQFFAYSTRNHLGDQVFFVGQAGVADPVYQEVATGDVTPRDILIRRDIRDAYGWASGGTEGTTSPSGYWTVSLTEAGANLSVVVTAAGRPATPVGTIARMPDQTGQSFATYAIRTAIWSDDESVVVIVLHQSLTGAYPAEVDTVNGFPVPPRPTPPAPAPTPAPAQGQ